MKKRLRKKLRLREFQEMGFHINFELVDHDFQEASDTFFNSLIAFAESSGLFLSGGLNFFYVTAASRHSVTEVQRQLLSAWLLKQPTIADLQISPLSDAWYVKDQEWNDVLPHELLGRPGLER